jgi:hypothetical protein
MKAAILLFSSVYFFIIDPFGTFAKQVAVLRTGGWISIGVRGIVLVATSSVNPGGIIKRGFLFHFFLIKDGRPLVNWLKVFFAVLLFPYIHHFYLAAKLLIFGYESRINS